MYTQLLVGMACRHIRQDINMISFLWNFHNQGWRKLLNVGGTNAERSDVGTGEGSGASAAAGLFVAKMVKIYKSENYRNDIFERILDPLKGQ